MAYDGEAVNAVRGIETGRNANIYQFTDVIYFNRQRAVFAFVMSTPLFIVVSVYLFLDEYFGGAFFTGAAKARLTDGWDAGIFRAYK